MSDKAIEEHGGTPVYLVDAATNARYVLLRAEQFEQVREGLATEEFNPRETYPFVDRTMVEDDANDPGDGKLPERLREAVMTKRGVAGAKSSCPKADRAMARGPPGDRGTKALPHRPELKEVKIGNDGGFRVAGVPSSEPRSRPMGGPGFRRRNPSHPFDSSSQRMATNIHWKSLSSGLWGAKNFALASPGHHARRRLGEHLSVSSRMARV